MPYALKDVHTALECLGGIVKKRLTNFFAAVLSAVIVAAGIPVGVHGDSVQDVTAQSENTAGEEYAAESADGADAEEEGASGQAENETFLFQENTAASAGQETDEVESGQEENDISDLKIEAVSADVPAEKVRVTTDNKSGWFRVTVSGVPDDVKSVSVPVWRDKNNQDDLHWYEAVRQADGTYVATANMYYHGFIAGLYYFDVYTVDANGAKSYYGGSTAEFTVSDGGVIVDGTAAHSVKVDIDNAAGWFLVRIEGTESVSDVSRVLVPVWSKQNGQDDLHWHEAVKRSDGVYTVNKNLSLHSFSADLYYFDVYTVNSAGKKTYFGGSTATFTTSADKPVLSETESGYKVEVNNIVVPGGLKSVKYAIWSSENWQDDLKWYTKSYSSSSKSSVLTYNAAEFSSYGLYYVDVYGVSQSGKSVYLGGCTYERENPSDSKIRIQSDNELKYVIKLAAGDVPSNAQNVRFAVWSADGGQDDIKWYYAALKDGYYTATANIKNHGSKGLYYVHAYADVSESDKFLYNTEFTLYATASGKASVVSENAAKGTFKVNVNITSASGTIGAIRVPVWSRADQSDLYWYPAEKLSDSSYSVTIDVKNHRNNSGLFYVDVYAVFANGLQSYVTGTTKEFASSMQLTVSNSNGSGTKRVTYINPSCTSVSFAVWSVQNGESAKWYQGISAGNGVFYCDVSQSEHGGGNGTYIVHVYSGNQLIANTSFSLIDYVEWAVKTSKDESIGYSQISRCLNPNVDCSSFVYYSLYYNGFSSKLDGRYQPFYTGSQVDAMKKCGFTVLDYTSEADLKPGDVLWYRSGSHGHTEIYIGDGLMVGARDCVINGINYLEDGDQTGAEVSVKEFSGSGWMKVLRIYS